MKSQYLKDLARANRIAIWKIADHMGVSENTLIRWLRHDLPEEKAIMFINAIGEIALNRVGKIEDAKNAIGFDALQMSAIKSEEAPDIKTERKLDAFIAKTLADAKRYEEINEYIYSI